MNWPLAAAAALIVSACALALVSCGNSSAVPTPWQQAGATDAANAADAVDAVWALQQKLEAGRARLVFDKDSRRGYLDSLLAALDIPSSSQSLVFAKNSFQMDYIAPDRPRAVYFNDDVYVGWTQGGPRLEIAAIDRTEGPVFYTLSQDEDEPPKFTRQTSECLVCHDALIAEKPIPRLLVLSVLPNTAGNAVKAFAMSTNDASPFRDRWGGWYVTGTHGSQYHMGNQTVRVAADGIDNVKKYLGTLNRAPGANVTDLSSRFDTKAYVAPSSDIVALMLLGHQTHVHNMISLASHEAREAIAANTPEARKTAVDDAELIVRAMLFARAAPLTEPVSGASGFAQEFQRRGPRDSRGRSLRELDLKTRLLRYPLSYLIYSSSFDAMPALAKDHVVRRLHEVLEGKDQSEEFAHLSAADRQAILEILRDTKPGF